MLCDSDGNQRIARGYYIFLASKHACLKGKSSIGLKLNKVALASVWFRMVLTQNRNLGITISIPMDSRVF